jgi:uncharacterized protein (TIGR04255 family)
MAKRYKEPPVIEAICEFRFQPDPPWDLAIPGLLYSKLRDDFPKRRRASSLEATRLAGPEGIEQQWTQVEKLQLVQEDENTIVQVSPYLLAVNRLRPYPGWEQFLPLVSKSLSAYQEVASPKGLQQITVRYINRFNLERSVPLEDYFDFYPFTGENLPQRIGSFIVGIQTLYEDGRDVLQMEMHTVVSDDPDTYSMVLDLIYFLGQPGAVGFEDVFGWLDTAHSHIEDVFEGCLKEPLRARFGEVVE